VSAAATLYRAAWVLPVAAPPVPRGAVLLDAGGRIAAVGPESSIEPPPGAAVEELGEAILLPGLVNAHAHPELAAFRGALEDLPFRDWILRLVGGKRRCLDHDDFLAAARWSCVESAAGGVTTVGATEASGAAVAALTAAGLRGVVYLEVFGPDPSQAHTSMADYRTRLAPLRAAAGDLVSVGISPHAPYTVSDALYRAATEMALAEGLSMACHIAESAVERRLVQFGDGDFAPGLNARGIATPPRAPSPVSLLERLGVLRARPLLIHCVDLDADDLRRIADAGASVAHCPVANARLGHGIAPVLRLRELGVPVGIGTDSVGSNNRLDVLEEARVASILQRGAEQKHDALPAAELLRMVTVEGARALGLQERVGTLEPGKDADLCAVSLAGAHVRPVHDPVAALFHAARASDVVLTVVRGRVVYRRGEPLPADALAAGARVEAAAERLRSSAR
jgi:cytosine/adenosine deaminase-related metal-dependent hydrolase